MKKVMMFLETMSRAVAAHRLAQMGYREEAKRLMCND
jgi:hypothetical protein